MQLSFIEHLLLAMYHAEDFDNIGSVNPPPHPTLSPF